MYYIYMAETPMCANDNTGLWKWREKLVGTNRKETKWNSLLPSILGERISILTYLLEIKNDLKCIQLS